MELQRGMREKLSPPFSLSSAIEIAMTTIGKDNYHCCCFCTGMNDKYAGDAYKVSESNPNSPDNEIVFHKDDQKNAFLVNFEKLPDNIQKVVFTITIEGQGRMHHVEECISSISQDNSESMTLKLSGKDFENETSIVSFEFYKKDEWRFVVVARGYNDGWDNLIRTYGGV